MYVASFFLGPLLDNYHGLFGVLSYGENSLPFSIQWHETVLLKSALWVPLTFGGAGLVMTAILKGASTFSSPVLLELLQPSDAMHVNPSPV